jgi:DNA-binding MarR family transcriptional regulator
MAADKITAKTGSTAEPLLYSGVVTEPQDRDSIEAVRALARASRILERASGELNLAHYRVLSAVESGDERASRVATRLALGKPTVSAAVASLCQRGLLAREAAGDDQRATVLRLTDQGRELLASVEAEMVRRLDDLRARTPGGDGLIDSLVWLGEAIDQAMAERAAKRREGAR